MLHLRKALIACALLSLAGCEKREVSAEAKQVEADNQSLRASAEKSWLVDLARDSTPLTELAQQSAGWREFFQSSPQKALKAFQQDLRKKSTHTTGDALAGPDLKRDLMIGSARSALELAQTYEALFELTQTLLPQWEKAVRAAPNPKPCQIVNVHARLSALGQLVRVYANQAQLHFKEAAVLCAEAVELIKAHGGETSQCALSELIATPPEKLPLSLAVLSEYWHSADLVVAARAWNAQSADDLSQTTIVERVWHAWASNRQNKDVNPDAFPVDRAPLQHALDNAIGALGEAGQGAQDVLNLDLSARTVDGLERRFADSIVKRDPALAVKLREDAEDKSAAAAPSPRNTLSSLAKSARDNVAISRYRVSLKYLSRLGLAEADLPSDLLRDLLTLRAMEAEDPAMVGQ